MSDVLVPVRKAESSHWYAADGSPVYEIENASKPGTMRPTTLRDARKLDLYPSVTTVLRMISKPGLDRWKIEQAIAAALTLPRLDDEPLNAYAARVAEDAEETSRKAADFGTRLHDVIEQIVSDEDHAGNWTCDEDQVDFASAFHAWWLKNDLKLCGAVCDFKTKTTEPGKKIEVYPEWVYQLGAYSIPAAYFPHDEIITERTFCQQTSGYGGRIDFVWRDAGSPLKCCNVIVSSTEPGRIEVKEWTKAEIDEAWMIFGNALSLWQRINKFGPYAKGEANGDR